MYYFYNDHSMIVGGVEGWSAYKTHRVVAVALFDLVKFVFQPLLDYHKFKWTASHNHTCQFIYIYKNTSRSQDYIACKGDHATYLPHTAGRYAKKRFRKASCPIVERLAVCLMKKGRNAGKKLLAVRIIQHTLEIIHLLTDQNPIQVVVDAIINSGPREDSTRVGGAGVVRRQAVDMSPFRRVNYALYLLATGAREASFRNLKTMAECLAEELINAARGSSNSYAIKKKDEIERVSKSNR